jgi:hypothetical protein
MKLTRRGLFAGLLGMIVGRKAPAQPIPQEYRVPFAYSGGVPFYVSPACPRNTILIYNGIKVEGEVHEALTDARMTVELARRLAG